MTPNDLLRLCGQLQSDSFDERWAAAEEIMSLGDESAPVVMERLERAYEAKPEHMRLVVDGLRKDLKDRAIQDLLDKGKKVDPEKLPLPDPPGFLKILLEKKNKNYPEGWRDAVEIVALLDALASMGTTESIGMAVDYAPRHEAAFRREIYQIVSWLGTRAVPALVRRQGAKDPDIHKVVSTSLAALEMERPGQQVQVKDPKILIEVLRAFGDHRNIDALDTVASFIDSDKDQVRTVAREVILAYGKLAFWTLKEQYKNYTGSMPDPTWDHQGIAADLFARMDAERMAPLDGEMDAALALAQAGKLEEMEKAYRSILARQPFYGRRTEMIPGYVSFGERLLEDGDLDRAALMFKVAQRLDEPGERGKAIAGRLWLIEGLRSVEEGAPDSYPFEKALENDPGLDRARSNIAEIERLDRRHRTGRYRMMGAVGIGSAALIALALLVLRRIK